MKVSPDARFVFTAGVDGTVFIYGVTEYETEGEVFKDEEERAGNTQLYNRDMIVDEELAKIVLIRRDEMEEWTKKQEQLKSDMDEMEHKLENTISETRHKYEKQLEEVENSNKKEKKNLEQRYKALMQEKSTQEHENAQNIKKMEMNHLERIEELQSLYDKKIFIENSNFLQQE